MKAEPTLAEICAVACAEAWRGDADILASPIGTIPTIGARLAASTFAPDLLYTDGDALLLAEAIPVDADAGHPRLVEGWMPFRNVFDLVWSGRRHVMMGATQVDRYGNQNIACIGPWERPRAQLLGMRGAPGNTVNHPTSYWVPAHSTRVFVEQVDCVSGVGYDRALAAGPAASEFHEIRRIVTDMAVLDFETPDHSMRLRSIHPGASLEQVLEKTGFPLALSPGLEETRLPTDEELSLIRRVLDPAGLRDLELRR
ncbi:MAG: CoA-transferase subunit beta [Acidimicrobiales bacterium]